MKNFLRLSLAITMSAVVLQPASSSPSEVLPEPPSINGLQSHWDNVGDGVIHYWVGGQGAPVVLLHGWPETGFAWRKIAPKLIQSGYQVIVPDLRGFGNSFRPTGGYDRLTMAEDIRSLTRTRLHLGPVFLVGHDWGGSVAATWAGAYPDEVQRLVVVEAQPRGPWSKPEPWFYAFHKSPGFAESITAGRERTYLEWFYRNYAGNPDAIGPDEVDVYLRTYGNAEGMRAGFELVRALPKDIEVNTHASEHPSAVPVLAIGGEKGMGQAVAENLKPLFTNIEGEVFPATGHYIPEEAPDLLSDHIIAFFKKVKR